MMRSRAASTLTMFTQLTQGIGPNSTIAPMIVPPDGGWGWVIVFVGVLCSALTDGFIYCFYLFREPMVRDIHCEAADISYLQSLNTGFYFIGAVLACSVGNYWGFRVVMIIGSVTSAIGLGLGYVWNEVSYHYVSYGIVVGLASGFITVGGGLPTGFYFDKKRSIAMGIVACGSGLGGLILPHTVELFMDHYGWRATFLFQGGCFAVLTLFGFLIRPLTPIMVVLNTGSQTVLRNREESVIDFSVFRVPPPMEGLSMAGMSLARSGVFDLQHTQAQPTISRMVEDVDTISIRVREDSDPTTLLRIYKLNQSRTASRVLQPSASKLVDSVNITEEPPVERKLPWYKCGCCRSKYLGLPERPLMRTDLYYTGSLMRLPEYTTKDKDLEYHMHVTRVPTYYQMVQDLTRTYTTWCCHNIFSGLKYLVDYTLFKSLAFNCLALCGFTNSIAFYLPFIFGKVQLEMVGEGDHAATMISMIGLGSMTGRLSSGLIITTCPRFGARTVVSFTNFIAGLAAIGVILYDNVYYKDGCMFLYGFTIGFFVPLRSIMIVDFFGLDQLTSATGMLILCLGVGSFLGPPLAELSIVWTNNQDAPFYVCGIALFAASISLWPMRRVHNWEKKRAAKKKRRQNL